MLQPTNKMNAICCLQKKKNVKENKRFGVILTKKVK